MATSLHGGSSLPFQGKPSIAAQGKPTQRVDEVNAEGLPSVEEIADFNQELLELRTAKNQQELEGVRKKKSATGLLGRMKEVQKVALSQILVQSKRSTGKTSKQPGLPAEIAALPKDHPIRQQWERGCQQRLDGASIESAPPTIKVDLFARKWVKYSALMLVVLIMTTGIIRGVESYREAVQKVRDEVVEVIMGKGYLLDDIEVRVAYMEVTMTAWLPKLEQLLVNIKKIKIKRSDEVVENMEEGSYLDHIRQYHRPFNNKEAIDWQTRSMRKPATGR
ncbi:MAG: hypothetical protein HQL87_14540 [Magnetococcales bacterium]|nr:hypothetical protein [Magnetococcales bacterium]